MVYRTRFNVTSGGGLEGWKRNSGYVIIGGVSRDAEVVAGDELGCDMVADEGGADAEVDIALWD